MTVHFSVSAAPIKLPRLRRRITSAYRGAQEIITKAELAPPSKMHALMLAYDKVCDQMRADIAEARSSFANPDELLAWLLDRSVSDIISEGDRMGLGLAARAVAEEIKKGRKGL
jgi:hypothetical protein